MLVLSSASVIMFFVLGKSNISEYFLVADSYKLFSAATGLVWFMFFKNLKIRQSKLINSLGGATFGVLCIHANSDAMRQWLWSDLLKNAEVFSKGRLIYVHSVVSVISIFIICSLIDIVRKNWVEKPFFKLWDNVFSKTVKYSVKKVD